MLGDEKTAPSCLDALLIEETRPRSQRKIWGGGGGNKGGSTGHREGFKTIEWKKEKRATKKWGEEKEGIAQ